MKVEDVIRCRRLIRAARRGPLRQYLDDFVHSASTVGYTPASLRDLVRGAIHFGEFLQERGLGDARDLRTEDVEAFIATQPLRRFYGKYYYPTSRGVRSARYLLRYLRSRGIAKPAQPPPQPIYEDLLEEWLTFLRDHRGLAPGSLAIYRRQVSRFLESLGPDATIAGLHCLCPDRVRDYVLGTAGPLSRSGRKTLVSTLRIFLRFTLSRGYIDEDFSLAVERVPSFTHERLPRGPRWENAIKLLETPDRTTALGRRDYAILLLLLTYGIRAGQVCSLSLEEINWREDTIRFGSTKGGRVVEVPILAATGEALLAYIQHGRPASSSGNVFLSVIPPFRGLVSGSIYNITSQAFRRAGIDTPHRGSHALRHAWATRMLALGHPLKTIADLIGHRSLETTRIYAKVDHNNLGTVGLPWPKEAVI